MFRKTKQKSRTYLVYPQSPTQFPTRLKRKDWNERRSEKNKKQINKRRQSARKKCGHVQLYSHWYGGDWIDLMIFFELRVGLLEDSPKPQPSQTSHICFVLVSMNFGIASDASKSVYLSVPVLLNTDSRDVRCMIVHEQCMNGVWAGYDRGRWNNVWSVYVWYMMRITVIQSYSPYGS